MAPRANTCRFKVLADRRSRHGTRSIASLEEGRGDGDAQGRATGTGDGGGDAETAAPHGDRGRQEGRGTLAGPHESVALPRHDRALASLRRAAPTERRGAGLGEVEDPRREADAVEAVDLLHAGRAGDVDLGHEATDHVEADEVESVGRQAWRERAADLAVTVGD